MRESRVVTRGLFLTFEGIEGSGKTVQTARAAAYLGERGVAVLATREPGGTDLGGLLRQALLHSRDHIDAGAELLLMFADRRHHVATVIEPALAGGTHVLCDRYTDASRAYQGAGRRLGEEAVDALHRRWCRLDPDRTYLFDCPVEIALSRVASRKGASFDRFEREDRVFHRRVRAAYRRRARKEPRRFLVLDATRSPDEIFERIARDLDGLLERHPPRRRRA
jgi:dTMP kinase